MKLACFLIFFEVLYLCSSSAEEIAVVPRLTEESSETVDGYNIVNYSEFSLYGGRGNRSMKKHLKVCYPGFCCPIELACQGLFCLDPHSRRKVHPVLVCDG